MPTYHSTNTAPALAANDNGPGARAMPATVLMGLVDLLAEVGAARLLAANDNGPLLASKEHAE